MKRAMMVLTTLMLQGGIGAARGQMVGAVAPVSAAAKTSEVAAALTPEARSAAALAQSSEATFDPGSARRLVEAIEA